jgi:hypothetical protein
MIVGRPGATGVPKMTPVPGLVNHTASKLDDPIDWAVHVSPPSAVRVIVPFPTATMFSESIENAPYKFAVVPLVRFVHV